MALGTITSVRSTVIGDLRMRIVDVVGAASYTTGGDALAPSSLDLASVDFCRAVGKTGSGYLPQYDHTNNTLKVYQGDNANAAAAPAVEVTATTNLSGQTFRLMVIGR